MGRTIKGRTESASGIWAEVLCIVDEWGQCGYVSVRLLL